MVKEVPIESNLSYIPASDSPLSADVVLVRGGGHVWIFDVGASDEVANYLYNLEYPTENIHIALSHFHADHTANLPKIRYGEVYGGKETIRHIHVGVAVADVVPMSEVDGDGLTLLPLPSSHAKGSLAMIAGDILFTGDGLYGRVNEGYNLQILYRTIQVLENLPDMVSKIALSHTKRFIFGREEVIAQLKSAYKNKETQNRLFFE